MKKIFTRLNKGGMSVTISIFLVVIFSFYWYTQDLIRRNSFRIAENTLTLTNIHIQNVLNSVEVSIHLAAFKIQDD